MRQRVSLYAQVSISAANPIVAFFWFEMNISGFDDGVIHLHPRHSKLQDHPDYPNLLEAHLPSGCNADTINLSQSGQ